MEILNSDIKSENDISRLVEMNSLNLENICRICLKTDLKCKYSIFEASGSQAAYINIMLVTKISIPPPEDNIFPSFMCEDCKGQLEIATNFKMKCEYSDAVLKKVFMNVKSKDVFIPSFKSEECVESKSVFEDIKDEKTKSVTEDGMLNSFKFSGKKGKRMKKKKNGGENVKPDISLEDEDVLRNIKEEVDDSEQLAADLEYSDENDVITSEYISRDYEEHKIKKIPCKMCNKLLKTKLSLTNHMHKYHNGKKSANIVPYKIEGYGKDRKFWCTFCEYVSKRKQGIVGHIRTHTGEKPFKCDECLMHFPTSSALCNHKKIHSDQMNHTCPQCGKQFRMKSKYEIHKSVHTTEKKFQCNVCNKFLKSKITLQIHLNRHDNIKNYSCEACGATFVTCSELISHSKSHGGEKKFKCTVCSFMTQTKAALDAHLLRHTGERKFECSYCETKCFTPAALRNHMIKHTKEKNYPCLFCEQKFAHSSSLNRHMVKTHEKSCKWMDLVDRRIVK